MQVVVVVVVLVVVVAGGVASSHPNGSGYLRLGSPSRLLLEKFGAESLGHGPRVSKNFALQLTQFCDPVLC